MITKINKLICTGVVCCGLAVMLTSCSNFLNDQVPQGTLNEEEVKNPAYVDNILVSAYAGLVTIEDMNASFSLWNYDTRSDDAYVGGSDYSDGAPFHNLELATGVMTTDWPFSSIWTRFYQYLSRVNFCLNVLSTADQSNADIQERIAEMQFLRAYGHFQLKRLFKKIPFVNKLGLTDDDIKEISNTEYTNDQGWQQIINDLEYAYNHLPVTQVQKGRPTKAAAAAFLAKVYLYKAYHQDDENTNQVTSINEDDLKKVIEYTNLGLYHEAGCELESDLHNNFRPEEQYENGKESIWAIQYSRDDGTDYGNLNFSNRLIPPELEGILGGCDFYKPSRNLVNAYVTDVEGHPTFTTSEEVYELGSAKTVDPRLFITVGIPGTQFMFNPDAKFKIEATRGWSRSGGNYGYFISLKQCVDPAWTGKYLINADNQWATSMNRIVFRYADVLLMRAEALAQLGQTKDAIILVNQVRSRAKSMQSSSIVANYSSTLNVHYNVKPYDGSYDKAEAMKIVKMERRLELAMESERFFDLVRWGDAEKVINDFYLNESKSMKFIEGAHFTANKNEYLPIPHEQMAASNGKYTQNCGNW